MGSGAFIWLGIVIVFITIVVIAMLGSLDESFLERRALVGFLGFVFLIGMTMFLAPIIKAAINRMKRD